MLEPRIVAARIHGPFVTAAPSHEPARISPASQGGLAMVIIHSPTAPHDDGQRWSPYAQVATTRPPAARMTSPVIQPDSSDARNTASGAISSTRPSRPSGVLLASAAPAPPSKVPAAMFPSVSV